jgi:hypothetical protein
MIFSSKKKKELVIFYDDIWGGCSNHLETRRVLYHQECCKFLKTLRLSHDIVKIQPLVVLPLQ